MPDELQPVDLRDRLAADLARDPTTVQLRVLAAWEQPIGARAGRGVLLTAKLLVNHRSLLVEASAVDHAAAYADLLGCSRQATIAAASKYRKERAQSYCAPLATNGQIHVTERGGLWHIEHRGSEPLPQRDAEVAAWGFRTASEAMQAARTHFGPRVGPFAPWSSPDREPRPSATRRNVG